MTGIGAAELLSSLNGMTKHYPYSEVRCLHDDNNVSLSLENVDGPMLCLIIGTLFSCFVLYMWSSL